MSTRKAVSVGMLTLALACSGALSQTGDAALAELTVVAYGAQTLDFATGRTILLEGGEIRDAGSDVWIEAPWISFLEGSEIEAERAVVTGSIGALTAGRLLIDLTERLLTASGGVAWQWEALAVQGRGLLFDPQAAVAGLVGDVSSLSPEFTGAELWIDLDSQRGLLIGPYRFFDELFELRGNEGSLLQIDFLNDAGEPEFRASSSVADDLRQLVAANRARAPVDFKP
jgi:hypothetical protein